MTLFHGGDVLSASQQYDIPTDEWIDLSTGINPCAYPLKQTLRDIDLACFEKLPYLQPDFLESVESYYGSRHFLAVPGTQSAIQLIPASLNQAEPTIPVILPSLGYQEHEHAWRINSKHTYYDANDLDMATTAIDAQLAQNPSQHLVVINPNNPTDQQFSVRQLQQWASMLKGGGHLVVDEAFIDSKPECSLLSQPLANNVIVLRSFGKFFGLAGIRVGFVFANQDILNFLGIRIGPWSINGPAQAIVTRACHDIEWQLSAREKIGQAAQLSQLLFSNLFSRLSVKKVAHSCLFSSYWLENKTAQSLFEFFACRGLLIRCLPIDNNETIVRIGCVNPESKQEIASLKGILRQAEKVFGEHDQIKRVELKNLRKQNA